MALALAACAALPDDAPVVEQLDEDTGLTVARFGHAFELYRETFSQNPTGRFAFIGPFETNSMGKRDLYLWLAAPVELAPNTTPIVEVNGSPLVLETPGRAPDHAGLTKSPYKIPTPWSAMFYYRIDSALLAQLGNLSSITLRVLEATKDGNVKVVFSAQVGEDPRFREFAAKHGN